MSPRHYPLHSCDPLISGIVNASDRPMLVFFISLESGATECRLAYSNVSGEEITGVGRHQAVGKRYQDIFESDPASRNLIDRALRSGQAGGDDADAHPDASEKRFTLRTYGKWLVMTGDAASGPEKGVVDSEVRHKYQTLVSNMQQAFCIIEVLFGADGTAYDYRFLETNPVFEQQTGLSDVIGRTIKELAPAHERYWFEIYGDVVRSGNPVHFEKKASQLAGGVWYDVFALPIGPRKRHQVAIFFNDITIRKKREYEQEYRVCLSEALSSGTDPETIEQAVTEAALQYFAADRCGFCSFSSGRFFLAHDAAAGNLARVTDDLSAPDLAVLTNLADSEVPVAIDDISVSDMDATVQALCDRLSVMAFIYVPIKRKGQLRGIFCIGKSVPYPWEDLDIRLVAETADRLSLAMERARAEQKLLQRNEQFSLAEEAANGFVYDWRLSDGRVSRSLGFYRILGYSPEDIERTETAWLELIHPDDLGLASVAKPENLGQENRFAAEYRVRRKDGQYIYILDRGMAIRDESGICRIVGSAVDITARRQAEAALRESEHRTQAINRLVPVLLWELDASGEMISVNQRWHDYTGQNIDDTGDGGWLDAIHPDDRGHVARLFAERFTNPLDFEVEQRIRRHDGQYLWFLTRHVPIRDNRGKVHQWFGAGIEIHARKMAESAMKHFSETLEQQVSDRTARLSQSEAALMEANATLQESVAQLETFNYVASHDLQEPLRKIQIFLGRMDEPDVEPDKAREYFAAVKGAAYRMRELINDLLVYSQLGHGLDTVRATDLNQVLAHVMEDYGVLIGEKNAQIESGPLPVVKAVPFQMRQLFANLVSNAMKFSSGRPVLKIRCESVPGSQANLPGLNEHVLYARLTFADNGIGFDNQYAAKIFQLFHRLPGKIKVPGTGVGLSIVEKIARDHGGAVQAWGEKGKGATFTVYLPLKKPFSVPAKNKKA